MPDMLTVDGDAVRDGFVQGSENSVDETMFQTPDYSFGSPGDGSEFFNFDLLCEMLKT